MLERHHRMYRIPDATRYGHDVELRVKYTSIGVIPYLHFTGGRGPENLYIVGGKAHLPVSTSIQFSKCESLAKEKLVDKRHIERHIPIHNIHLHTLAARNEAGDKMSPIWYKKFSEKSLTAICWKSLGKSIRQIIMQHLPECTACRDEHNKIMTRYHVDGITRDLIDQVEPGDHNCIRSPPASDDNDSSDHDGDDQPDPPNNDDPPPAPPADNDDTPSAAPAVPAAVENDEDLLRPIFNGRQMGTIVGNPDEAAIHRAVSAVSEAILAHTPARRSTRVAKKRVPVPIEILSDDDSSAATPSADESSNNDSSECPREMEGFIVPDDHVEKKVYKKRRIPAIDDDE